MNLSLSIILILTCLSSCFAPLNAVRNFNFYSSSSSLSSPTTSSQKNYFLASSSTSSQKNYFLASSSTSSSTSNKNNKNYLLHQLLSPLPTSIPKTKSFFKKLVPIILQTSKSNDWIPIHNTSKFSLYRRIGKPFPIFSSSTSSTSSSSSSEEISNDNYEYMMTGTLPNVSLKNFLKVQIDPSLRLQWDHSARELKGGGISLDSSSSTPTSSSTSSSSPLTVNTDVLYYRSKCPWPMKDRDYILERRCEIFEKEKAILLFSKATCINDYGYKLLSNVIRIPNSWSISLFIKDTNNNNDIDNIDNNKNNNNNNSDNKQYNGRNKDNLIIKKRNYDIKIKKLQNSVPFNKLCLHINEISNDIKKIISIASSLSSTSSASPSISSLSSSSSSYSSSSSSYFSSFNKLSSSLSTFSSSLTPPLSKLSSRINKKFLFLPNIKKSPLISSTSLPSHSTTTSTSSTSSTSSSSSPLSFLDEKGIKYITIFSDDQKVSLPPKIIDFIAKQGEKSMNRLINLAMELDQSS